MLLFKKVNSKVLSINNYLQKYLESNQFEKNLKEALNNKNYGVSNSLLYDLSISTYDANYYKRVLSEVFKAIQEKPSKWRRIYKGLRLCEYVMKNGCEYFISDVKDKEELIKKLTHFTFLEDLKDKGVCIREISNNILTLLRDNKHLKNERMEAAKYANICTNIESKPIEKKGFFSSRKKKTKNKGKKMLESNKRNYMDTRTTRNPQEKSIFDQIEEERNMLNKYASNNYDMNDNVHRSDDMRRGSGNNSASASSSDSDSSDNSSGSSGSSSSSGSGTDGSRSRSSGYISGHKSSRRKSGRGRKHRNASSHSSKYSRSSSASHDGSRSSYVSRSKSARSSSCVSSRSSSRNSSASSSASRSSSRSSRYSSASSHSSYSSKKKSHARDKNRKSRSSRRNKSGRSR
ncbi:ENTH domain-containing protein [Plasmodium coatneyi]|uniref:ENTH domain-containing protein n=1 Tax=Plasmodium coatneyi TaxID=208452 RepID=A0A1B1E7X9_9APIC|nr:ENTH domain-containing protein [Plasmodium coatneyi]ANQ11105.1 ENTH domain-containing protein [Plasmodium coatneyi]